MLKSLILATIAGSLAPAALFLVVELARELLGLSHAQYGSAAHLTFAGMVALVSFGIIVVYALPLFLLARRFNAATLAVAAVASIIPGLVFAFLEGVIGDIVSVVAWVALALSSGLAFWFFARGGVRLEVRA